LRTEVTASVLDPLGLAFPEYICMRLLSHSPGISNAELARSANVSRQAMNLVVRELQERGLVTRPASVSSGRSRPTQLTTAGTELLARTDAGLAEAESQVLAKLSPQDRREFRRLLAALA
jgi:DNA-binding MarR family transcriptional regulator